MSSWSYALAGLWLVKDTTIVDGFPENPFLNIYGYRSNLAVIDEANQIAIAFVAQMTPKIIAVQSVECYHTTLEVIQLDGTNFHNYTFVSANSGLRTGQRMPDFVGWGYTIQRASLGVRAGSKRIGPISESDVDDGAANGGVATVLNALATQIATPLTVGIIQTWFPVILERPVPPATVWGDHPVGGCIYKRVTSQNTRKR